MSTPWLLAADLLEQEPPEDDLDRHIREAAGGLDWRDCGARLVSFLRELRPYPGEVAAAHQVATWLPSVGPKGWEQAPNGVQLEQAILEAYRAIHGPAREDGRVR